MAYATLVEYVDRKRRGRGPALRLHISCVFPSTLYISFVLVYFLYLSVYFLCLSFASFPLSGSLRWNGMKEKGGPP